jgi:hypothetical protein
MRHQKMLMLIILLLTCLTFIFAKIYLILFIDATCVRAGIVPAEKLEFSFPYLFWAGGGGTFGGNDLLMMLVSSFSFIS